jgi:hypothetical protein
MLQFSKVVGKQGLVALVSRLLQSQTTVLNRRRLQGHVIISTTYLALRMPPQLPLEAKWPVKTALSCSI